MSELVARTGRHQQRYEDGYRLIAGEHGKLEKRIQRFIFICTWHFVTQRPTPQVSSFVWCVPFKYIYAENNGGDSSEMIVEVLMINSTSGPGLLFPKGGWENDETAEDAAVREAVEEAGVRGDLMHYLGCYSFKSKTLQDEYSPEGLCRASMYALYVEEELESWPEKSHRERSWLTIPEAISCLDARGGRRRFLRVVC